MSSAMVEILSGAEPSGMRLGTQATGPVTRPDPSAGAGADQAKPRRARAAPGRGLAFALLAAVALLPGCSRTDPIEQARVLAGRAPSSTLPPVPGAGEPYPSLGTVPPRPETTPPAARQALAEALVADRANARYIGQPAALAVPRGQGAAPSAPAVPQAAAPMLLGATQQDEPPLAPPPPPPPPIAGAPRPPAQPAASAAPPPSVLGVPQGPPPAATPALPAAGPLPPAGRAETAPIAPIAVEQLPPPPAPAMPSELPARARGPQTAAAGSSPQTQPPSPVPPVPRPAEPRAEAAQRAAVSPAPVAPPAAGLPAPAQPVQLSVIVDRTALLPAARRGVPETGYALAFVPGTATLAASDLAVLAGLAGRGQGAIFQVTGYADAPASGRALDLPLARARAVAEALRAAGVPAEQIELGGSARPGPAGRGAEVRLVYRR